MNFDPSLSLKFFLKTHFINNKEEGEHFFYDKNGNLIKTDIYKNDVKQ